MMAKFCNFETSVASYFYFIIKTSSYFSFPQTIYFFCIFFEFLFRPFGGIAAWLFGCALGFKINNNNMFISVALVSTTRKNKLMCKNDIYVSSDKKTANKPHGYQVEQLHATGRDFCK